MRQRRAGGAAAPGVDGIGLFGKVPTHGDFVSAGLSRAVETQLLSWLQHGLQACEQTLGGEWRRAFHAAPPWRFVIERPLWGEATIVGVVLPSADRVGRSFPLVLTAQIAKFRGEPRQFCVDDDWFSAAETLARASTTRDLDTNALMDDLRRLRLPQAGAASDAGRPADGERVSLFWTSEAGTGRASSFATRGAPGGKDFLRLLPGSNPGGDLPAAPEPALSSAAVPESALVMQRVVEHGYATHAGTRVFVNADALLISDSPFLFAIADGVGDGGGAVDAAKITNRMLACVPACASLEALVQEIKGKLGRAHSLVQSLRRPPGNETPAASVVAFALQGGTFAVIWAGDARCYLVRNGVMRCLTRDHLEIGIRFALRRSVGAPGPIIPEVITVEAETSDQLVLCSAPLVRTLGDRAIAETVLALPATESARALIQNALIADARENVSAIVVKLGDA